jgi:uncharacterized protein
MIRLESAIKREELQPPDEMISKYILVKLAARCNINCTYCYWFRDHSVFEKPKVLPPDIEEKFIERLRFHLNTFKLTSFTILFHGGEPMLFGKARLRALCEKLVLVAEETGARISKAMTTNGVLIDRDWSRLFREHEIGICLSLDGAQEQHDSRRVDFAGKGTYAKVVEALSILRDEGLDPSALAVCDPHGDPARLCSTLVEELGFRLFDVLIPEATHEDKPDSVAAYYVKLFDLWFDKYCHEGVNIRCAEEVLKGVMGLRTSSEAIGYGPLATLTMLTDGSLEPLDVLRIAGYRSTQTSYNVVDHQLHDVQNDEKWKEALYASLNLSEVCQTCDLYHACGGGYLPTRWSKERRYDNPSVYCPDHKIIFQHVRSRVAQSLYIQPHDGTNPVSESSNR